MKIAHLADIHVKDQRRREYAAVFEALTEQLKADAPDVIAIAGDVFDTMTRASARNWEDVATLLSLLAGVAPVVVIPGNHDMNVRAAGSPDLLGPLLEAAGGARGLQAPRVTYWKTAGIREAFGAVWVVGVPGQPLPDPAEAAEALARANPGTPLVALFHESVGGARFPNGLEAGETPLSRNDLGAYARAAAASAARPFAALLGDIHLRQEVTFPGSGPAAAAWYPGSLVCQNFGESHLGHGYLLWTLTAAAAAAATAAAAAVAVAPREVANPRAYLTLQLGAAGDETPGPLPERPRAYRIVHADVDPRALKRYTEEAEAKYGFGPRSVETRKEKTANETAPAPAAPASSFAAAIEASGDWDKHAEIAQEILTRLRVEPGVAADALARYRTDVAARLGGKAVAPRPELARLEFDDIFCYGPGNVVDFDALRAGRPGLVGFVAPNRAGKSSLFDVLTFACCDDVPRGDKRDLSRRGGPGYRLRLVFRVDGVEGRVEKSGGAPGLKRTENTVRFWLGGKELTEATAPATAARVREYLGTRECLEAVTFFRPAEVTGVPPFALAKAAERRQIVSSLLDLGAFEDLERRATGEIAGLRGARRAALAHFPGSQSWKEGAVRGPLEAIEAGLEAAAEEAASAYEEALATEQEAAAEVQAANARFVDASAAAAAAGVFAAQAADAREELAAAESAVAEAVAAVSRAEAQTAKAEADLAAHKGFAAGLKYEDAVAAVDSQKADLAKARSEHAVASARLADSEEAARRAAEQARGDEPSRAVRELAARFSADTATADTAADTAALAAAQAELKAAREAARETARACKEAGIPTEGKVPSSAGTAAHAAAPAALDRTLRDLAEARRASPIHVGQREQIVRGLNQDCQGCANTRRILGASDASNASKLFRQATALAPVAAAVLEARIAAAVKALALAEAANQLAAKARRDEQQKAYEAVFAWERAAPARAEAAAAAAKVEERRAELRASARVLAAEEDKARVLAGAAAGLAALAKAQAAEAEARARLATVDRRPQARARHEQAAARAAETSGAVPAAEKAGKILLAAQNAHEAARRRGATLQAKCAEAGEALRRHAGLAAAAVQADREVAATDAYRRLLHPENGVGAQLLRLAVSGIAAEIDVVLAEMDASFRIALEPDCGLTLVDQKTKVETPPALGSGYQQFVLALAARWALSRVARVAHPACFLIDEGFGCLDDQNLPRIAEALGVLAQRVTKENRRPLVLAVTHREDMAPYFAERLAVTLPDGGGPSRVTFPPGAAADLETVPRRVTHQAPPKFCDACGTDVAAASWEAHLRSARHGLKAAPVRRCEPCGVDVAAAEWEAHCRAPGHAALRCEICDREVAAARRANHEATAAHQKMAEEVAARDRLLAEHAEAEAAPGGKLFCTRCPDRPVFTAKQWPRHAASARHAKTV